MISSLGILQQEHFVYSSTKPWHNAAGYNKHLLFFAYSEAHLQHTALQLTLQWQHSYFGICTKNQAGTVDLVTNISYEILL